MINEAAGTPSAGTANVPPVIEGTVAGGAAAPNGADGKGAEGLPDESAGAAAGDAVGDPAGTALAAGEDGGDPPGDPASGDEPTGAPEAYVDFTLPEGLELEPEATSAFKEAAKADNLSQAQAQKYVDMASGLVKKTLDGFQEQHTQRVAQWGEQAKADPVVGGRDYEANVQVALSAVTKFGDPELKQAFEEYGLGNHPAFVRAFYRIGKAMGESGFVHGQGHEQPAAPVNREAALAARIKAEQQRNAK
jgi:hypothetical protein